MNDDPGRSIHCMHCGTELDAERDIAPKEYPKDSFLDKLSKSLWAFVGDGTLYLCPECFRTTPWLSDRQVETFVKFATGEPILLGLPCPTCNGTGTTSIPVEPGGPVDRVVMNCPDCNGTGRVAADKD